MCNNSSVVNQTVIAEKLNLSPATISRCLRSRSGTDPKTRARVLRVASEMGYLPNGSTGTRRPGRPAMQSTHLVTLAVLVQMDVEGLHRGGTVSQLLTGMSAEVGGSNAALAIHHVTPEKRLSIGDPEHQPATLRFGHASGAILIRHFERAAVRSLAAQLPCVSLVLDYTDMGVDCVDNNQRLGIAQAVRCLAKAGHRRLGYVSGLDPQSWAWARLGAMTEVLSISGLPIDSRAILNELINPLEPGQRINQIAQLIREGVTGWVFVSDTEAYSAVVKLRQMGLECPRDYSAVGFNAYSAPPGLPKLTSIRNRYEAMGSAAVRRLFERIQRPADARQHVQIECELVEGETTGPWCPGK